MGFSGGMQFMIPIGFVVILFKFIIVDFKNYKYIRHITIGTILYSLLKVLFLKVFNYDEKFIAITVIMLFISLLFIFLKIYKANKNKSIDCELLLTQAYFGSSVGIGLILFPLIIRILNLNYLFNGESKIFYLLLVEYLISGLMILSVSKKAEKTLKYGKF